MMRVAGYIRVSTDEQADKGNSPSEQKERLTALCISKGWNPPVFFSDECSAKDLNRPDMKRLIESVKRGEWDVVATTKLDRLSRNLLDTLQLVKLLDKHNCSYVSASEDFNTSTAAGRMTLQLLGSFAEFERGRISERVKDNMTSIAKNTDKAITLPCYGYDIMNGKYVINTAEEYFLNIMLDLAEQGDGYRMIAKKVNELGSRTKRGYLWDQRNVKRLLFTDTIAGIFIYNMRETKDGKTVIRDKSDWIIKENHHPAIVESKRLEKIRAILKTRSKSNKHTENETYLLTGLLVCKHCGRNMRGSTARVKRKNNNYTYYRYICSSYILGYGCKYHALHRDEIEEFVINQLKEIATISHREMKIRVAASLSASEQSKEIKNSLSKIDKQMQKQIDAYVKELITESDLKKATERAESERKKLTEQLSALDSKKNGNPGAVKSKIISHLDDITGIDRIKAKKSLCLVIDQIEIENGEIVDIVFKS